MIYVLLNGQKEAFGVAASLEEAKTATSNSINTFESRNDWTSKEQVDALAQQLTVATGKLFLGLDNGRHISPRYDIYKGPAVGDVVSMGFNGDYYPCGKITTISKTMKRIVTDKGEVFYRKGNSGRWVNNGTFVMVPGEHNERNPSF